MKDNEEEAEGPKTLEHEELLCFIVSFINNLNCVRERHIKKLCVII